MVDTLDNSTSALLYILFEKKNILDLICNVDIQNHVINNSICVECLLPSKPNS
jgi:hypothetical protein